MSGFVAPLAGSAPLLVALALTRGEPRKRPRVSCYAQGLLLAERSRPCDARDRTPREDLEQRQAPMRHGPGTPKHPEAGHAPAHPRTYRAILSTVPSTVPPPMLTYRWPSVTVRSNVVRRSRRQTSSPIRERSRA